MLNNPFRSFWMAGYECTDQLNAFGKRVDFLTTTGHLALLEEDYKLLQPYNIKTVREGIRWSFVEKKPYEYDFSTVAAMMEIAQANNIQQVWDICHFGFPDDLTPLHPMFARRFAALCKAFVKFYRSQDADSTLIITPINEVSFLSYLGGEVRGTSPYCIKNGWEVKYALMKAYIEGVRAMKEVDADIIILTAEPLVNIVPQFYATEEQVEEAAKFHEYQFQAVDMLIGRVCPELGGQPGFLDIPGFNYYYNNQWIWGTQYYLPWANDYPHPHFLSLRTLLMQAYQHFDNKPFAITETSHPEEDRPKWITSVAAECAALIKQDMPLLGICLYPIIDRPDWDKGHPWHCAGLWDADIEQTGKPQRNLYKPYAGALLQAQALIDKVTGSKKQFGNLVLR